MDLIDLYIEELLFPQLTDYGIAAAMARLVSGDVKQRLCKVVAYETVLEEARCYSPRSATLEIKQVVNFALRNSMFEELCCDAPAVAEIAEGRLSRIIDCDVSCFTKAAIRFFKLNWSLWPMSAGHGEIRLESRFPIASYALRACSSMDAGIAYYYSPVISRAHQNPKPSEAKWPGMHREIQSGYDRNIAKAI